ncbi:hypothetical protein [Pseudomonas sp. R3-18-08]|uniref:hypothetical protein n=1 Tax=Pseudomonas sp. R3-18-08 TaxID=1173283 RepID=UPI000F566EDD|nr:hypothetical protein [Pseudomonas sp. R3-18-08]AZF13709.1 putative membrane protein [Pseudomonas sp. R3-18-08]
MSLSDTQLKKLDKDIDNNQQEMVVLTLEDANAIIAESNTSSGASTQPPVMCSRTQPGMLDGLWGGTQSIYNATLHPTVNTSWATATALGSYDAYNISRLLRDIGGFGTKIRITVKNGKQYVVLTGYPGLRRRLNGTRYGIRNAQLVEMGIGRYGVRGSSIAGFKLSCYVAVGIEVLEWIFNDEAVLSDLFAGIGVELVKAGIATAIGYAAALAIGAVFTAAALPVVVGAIVVFAISIGLNVLDNKYGIKDSVKSGMRYAVDNVRLLHERATKVTTKDLQRYMEDIATQAAQSILDQAYDETKSWILRKIQPGELPLPNWPKTPTLPNFSDFKLPKF